MKRPETLLIFADSEHDANMLSAPRLFVPDPFVYLNIRGRALLVMNDLEIDRARVQAPHCQVISLSDHQKKLRAHGVRHPRTAEVIRSEGHMSELQSRQYLVCRLLLEKKTKHPSTVP